ncbi:hypothetical protein EGR52_10335 [bacterium]|nr:hypothetical protein [bacterium]
MLEDLEVLNGEMDLEFSSLIDYYTVSVGNDVYSLNLNYKLSDNATLNIRNNESLQEGNNYVYLDVYEGNKVNTYTLEVYKEVLKKTMEIVDDTSKVEVKSVPVYTKYLLIFAGLIVILFTYKILFRKGKKKY